MYVVGGTFKFNIMLLYILYLALYCIHVCSLMQNLVYWDNLQHLLLETSIQMSGCIDLTT